MSDRNDPISVFSMIDELTTKHAYSAPGGNELSKFWYRRVMLLTLHRIAINRIQWTGLPDRVTSELIEQTLFEGGSISLYTPSEVDKPILYRALGIGNINNERVPDKWQLKPLNLKQPTTVDWSDVAICDPLRMRLPVWPVILYYADLFEDFNKALRSNLKIQKTPAVILANQDQRLSMANFMDQYNKGEPAIYTYDDGGNPLDKVQAFTFNVDYVAGTMLVDRRQAWNDCMTLLGIDNSNQDKRERLVTGEVMGNNQQIQTMREIELRPRRVFAERVNELYGTNIGVDWNESIAAEPMPAGGDADYWTRDQGNVGQEGAHRA